MTQQTLFNRDFISIDDFSRKEIESIMQLARRFKESSTTTETLDINGKIIASCFFEPSTRTRLSFETAALKLNAKIIGFTSDDTLSTQKGETFSDTVRMIDSYADLIIVRHPLEGAALLAAEMADHPVINAGDGANQHPTQALIDFFTILECQTNIDGLAIGLVGDLKYSRTIHSFIQLCKYFDVRLYLIAPDILSLPETICNDLKKNGIRFSFHQSLNEVIAKLDILYATRIQQERFPETMHDVAKDQFIITPSLLKNAKENLKILHPLPRVNEIHPSCDSTPYAYYFQQASNGVPVRQALLSLILNELPLP